MRDTTTMTDNTEQMIKIRRKWVDDNICFVCEKKIDDEDLKPCQCFKKNGVKGFGMIFCQDCDDDVILNCGGTCSDRLCRRSCEYITCGECKEPFYKKCIGKFGMDPFIAASCGNCEKKVCVDCAGCHRDEPCLPKTCFFCQKEGCNSCCKEGALRECDVCDEVICNACVDPRCANDPTDDERLCRRCADGVADDFGREDDAIRQHGADHDDY